MPPPMTPASRVGGAIDRQQEADPGTLADAATAELVGLDLALVVEDEDADRIELDVVVPLVPGLQRLDRIVCGGLVLEERQYDCFAATRSLLEGLVSRAGGARTTAVTRSWFAVRTSHTARRVVHPTPLGTGPTRPGHATSVRPGTRRDAGRVWCAHAVRPGACRPRHRDHADRRVCVHWHGRDVRTDRLIGRRLEPFRGSDRSHPQPP